jgi:transposase
MERDIEQALIKSVRKAGGLCLKFVSPGWSGVPDRLCLWPGGKVWSAIIKVESENSPKYGRIGRHRKVRKMATYEKSFKEEAVKLSDEIGIKKAAAQLGVPYYTLADWRHRQNIHGDQAHVGSGHKRETGDEKDRRIRELERENAELARANEILQEALGFFAKNRKK